MTPEVALCVGRDRLLITDIKIGNHVYSAIVDSAATSSYLPLNGRVISQINPLLQQANVKSRLAVDERDEVSKLETTLSFKLARIGDQRPVTGRFLTINGQGSILGHDLLLGLPEMRALKLSLVPQSDQYCVTYGNQIVG